MEWATVVSENFGAILGVLGTIAGVTLGAWLESIRRRGDERAVERARLLAKRSEAHEQMHTALARVLAAMSRNFGVALAPNVTLNQAAKALIPLDEVSDEIHALIAAQGRVFMYSPETAELSDRASQALIIAGTAATAVKMGQSSVERLRETHLDAMARHSEYSRAAAQEVRGERALRARRDAIKNDTSPP